jgi:hypothetical protein
MTIAIGFTGTRNGMTEAQKTAVHLLLIELFANPIEIVAHHGDCVGADADFHAICREVGVGKIVAHPPDLTVMRAFTNADEVRLPRPYLVRNGNIVFESREMIATPSGFAEERRSGTWSTIRKARLKGKSVAIVYPDGRIEKRR